MISHRKIVILLLLFQTDINLGAQNNDSFNYIDKLVMKIPDSLTYSTRDLANYFNRNFFSQKEKVRAIYHWLSKNIAYDCENMFAFDIYEHEGNKADSTLKLKCGVCQDYARLFYVLGNSVGIKTYFIKGYTKRNRHDNPSPHAWCVSMIDSIWYFFDPTWGAGYIDGYDFVKQSDDTYFMVSPKIFMKTHMPFDPLWQFSEHPITYKEFDSKKKQKKKLSPYFKFIDTVKIFEKLTNIEKLVYERNRILKNGISNYLTYNYIFYLNMIINNFYEKQCEQQYFSAVKSYNEGIYLLNKYSNYRNKYYMPYKSDTEISQMLENIEAVFISSETQLEKLEKASPIIGKLAIQLQKLIKLELTNLKTERTNLNKYLKTAQQYRESLSHSSEKE